MDPITAGLFVAASLGASLYANKSELRTNAAAQKIQIEQSRLQGAEQAFERTKGLRQNLSANLALSGTGYGGTSGIKGITAENISDYFADVNALNNQDLFLQVGGVAQSAANKADKFTKDVVGVSNAAILASQLGLFKGKKVK